MFIFDRAIKKRIHLKNEYQCWLGICQNYQCLLFVCVCTYVYVSIMCVWMYVCVCICVHVYVCMHLCIHPTPLPLAGCDIKSIFFSWVNLVSILSFPSPRLQSAVLFTHGWKVRLVGFMPFPRALVQREAETALSRIWTWVTNSISFNNKFHAKHSFAFVWRCLMCKNRWDKNAFVIGFKIKACN